MKKGKNIQILSVYGIEPSKMHACLKTIQGLHFRTPRMNGNGFCEVEIISATPKQWQSIMKLY